MVPSAELFIQHAKRLRIRKDDLIICYDCVSMLGSPRLWFWLRMFGAKNVKILNGGLGKWKAEGRAIEAGDTTKDVFPLDADLPTSYAYLRDSTRLVTLKQMYELVPSLLSGKNEAYLIDGRAPERFNGIGPELWPTLRAGHIPGSINIRYKEFLNPDGMTLKTVEELRKVFASYGVDTSKKIVSTCLLGIIACNTLFALWTMGKRDLYLYDGSWREYVLPTQQA